MSAEIERALTPRQHAKQLFMQGVPKAEIAETLGLGLPELQAWAAEWASVDVDTIMPVQRVMHAFATRAVPLVENLMAACERLAGQLHTKPHKELMQSANVIAKMASTVVEVVKTCNQKTDRILDPISATQVNMHFPGVRLPDPQELMNSVEVEELGVESAAPARTYLDDFRDKAVERLGQMEGVAEAVVDDLSLQVARSPLDMLRDGEDIGARD